MMKEVLIDTSYLLPLFGIDVKLKKSSRKHITGLWKEGILGYNINISDVTLLEVLYKLNSDFRKIGKKQVLDRYSSTIPTILTIPFLNIIQSKLDPMIINYANKLRFNGHTDYLDCLIFGTAMKLNAVFMTEDTSLKDLLKTVKEFEKLKVLRLDEIVRKTENQIKED